MFNTQLPEVQEGNRDPVLQILREIEPYAGSVRKDGLHVPRTMLFGRNGPLVLVDTRDDWGARGGQDEEPRRLAFAEVMSHAKHVFIVPFLAHGKGRWRPRLYDEVPAIISRCWDGGVVFLLTTTKTVQSWAEIAALRGGPGATVEYLASNDILAITRRMQ